MRDTSATINYLVSKLDRMDNMFRNAIIELNDNIKKNESYIEFIIRDNNRLEKRIKALENEK